MAKPDGVIVPGDVVKRNRHKKVLNHNYLPLLAQGTPCFARACALCGTPDDLTKSNLLVVIKKET
ncbi:MAG: hypothetical protein ACLRFM_04010, partial [Alphaproteobacteria bacterium]